MAAAAGVTVSLSIEVSAGSEHAPIGSFTADVLLPCKITGNGTTVPLTVDTTEFEHRLNAAAAAFAAALAGA